MEINILKRSFLTSRFSISRENEFSTFVDARKQIQLLYFFCKVEHISTLFIVTKIVI